LRIVLRVTGLLGGKGVTGLRGSVVLAAEASFLSAA